MIKKYSYLIFLLIFISGFKPLNNETEHIIHDINKNIKADEKWQVSVNVKRHLDKTELIVGHCGDPCNCTRIDFHSISDIEYSFSGETDVIPLGSDVLVKLESDNVGGNTKYTHTNTSTDLCTGKSCTEVANTIGTVKTAGGYFEYKPSTREGLLLMNYYSEGSGEATNDCRGVIQIYNCLTYLVSQPQYMNYSLNDKFDSLLLGARKREYDSLKHLLPDWMPKLDFEEIEKSRQEQKNMEQTTDSVSYTDKYALNVTEKESGFIAKVSYTKTIELPKNYENHTGYTKYTFTENITVEVGSLSEITLKQISKDWVPEKDSLVDVTVKWHGAELPNKLKFTLYDVSAEPGDCLNSEDDNLLPDLEFDWDGLFDFEKISETEVIVKPEAYDGNECTISLKSKDFGTYAKLKAEGDFGNGWEPIKADEINENFIRIPYDINMNNIADKWEKDVGVFGMNLSPSWDEDPEPANQRRNGDGYVLYEEYRGFNAYDHLLKKPDNEQIKDMHFRSDPLYKDVFVFPEGFSFKSMYRSNPSDLNWHIVTRNDIIYNSADAESHRWVNNKTSHKFYYAKQYAINVRVLTEIPNWDSHSESASGLTYKINLLFEDLDSNLVKTCSNAYSNPLKCFAACFILADNIYNSLIHGNQIPVNVTDIIMRCIERTLIHEIGHNLGIKHHGGGGQNDPLTYEYPACSMRYSRVGEFLGYDEYDMFVSTERNYCKSGPFNCYGQIDVKSNP